MKETLEDLAKGTAQANLSPVETANMRLLAPPEDLLKKYSAYATPLLGKFMHNRIQIRTLEKLRDTLLPKLMSGEVRVEVEP
jgi:type I restriction enzyme S subunit